jgi:replicative DNA helicase
VKGRTLPSNPEAEEVLVHRLLLDPRKLALVAGSLRPEHFYSADPRALYAAMLGLEAERKIIDVVSVAERAGVVPPAPEFGRMHHGSLEGYAEIIRRDWQRRETIRNLERAIGTAYESSDPERLLDAVGEAVAAVNATSDGGDLLSPADAVDGYLGTLEARRAGLEQGLKWGIPALDRMILPAQRQNLIIVAARPSIGKTALVEWIADAWAKQDQGPILFASLEMSKDELIDRAISRQIKVSTDALIRGTLTGDQWRLALEAAEKLRQVGIWYYDKGGLTTARLRSEVARVKMMSGGRLGGLIVDYLGLLGDTDGGDNQVTVVTRISRKLKAIAKDFNVPVLVAAQLNRNSEHRSDPTPILSDLRDSGAIEQDADLVLGLHRSTKFSTNMVVKILKARQGAGADNAVTVHFDPPTMTFSDWTRPVAPAEVPLAAGTPVDEADDPSWD